ncbi:RNA polymerase sigma factor [Dyadobacter diqingensis]|uniref:RNA polymerase sigma factor n=1 Tax=Dyadobacter diqingensis TaxID=2938121 RepID=UPI0020C1A962|nr:sigma-70 family RNA polymerase sigma factor [Dyadobacter diqingensis]
MVGFSEREIVAGLKRNGQNVNAIIRFLHNRNYPTIRKMVISLGGNYQDAEDLFQDVLVMFIEIVGNDEFDPDGEATVHTYLYSIAYRLWVKRWKREVKKGKWETEFASIYQKIDDVVKRFEDRLTAEQIISQLREPCRTILNGFYIEDLSLEEIGLKIKRSPDAVKQQKFRCLNLLKRLYE